LFEPFPFHALGPLDTNPPAPPFLQFTSPSTPQLPLNVLLPGPFGNRSCRQPFLPGGRPFPGLVLVPEKASPPRSSFLVPSPPRGAPNLERLVRPFQPKCPSRSRCLLPTPFAGVQNPLFHTFSFYASVCLPSSCPGLQVHLKAL